MTSRPTEDVLGEAIFELQEPIVFQNLLQSENGLYDWKLLQWNLSEFNEKLGDTKLPFRVGFNSKSVSPQWEINSSTELMTFEDFLKYTKSPEHEKKWYYFDYKHMLHWFKDNADIMNSLNWKRFGINKVGMDSTLWIGSKGAHSNCHQDTYGCNLVAQIHGRKEWLLFPPNASKFLKPIRVPYEESTVYSTYNFFSPSEEFDAAILQMPDKPRSIILEKGDVLLVPNGWWHYVESLDFSISVNVWLPIAADKEARVKEAIVQLIIARIGKTVCSQSQEAHCSFSYCLQLLDAALNDLRAHEVLDEEVEEKTKKVKEHTWTAKELEREYSDFVKLIPELDETQLLELLRNKRERFPSSIEEVHPIPSKGTGEGRTRLESSSNHDKLTESVVNALCHPEVIKLAADLLMESLES